jgi:hypothetical protein
MGSAEVFWTQPRVAGALIVGALLILLAVTVPVYVRGNVRAVEAQFRPIEVAVGQTSVLRVASATLGPWVAALLAAFVILGVDLMKRGSVLLPALAMAGLIVFTVAWVMEAAFHTGITVWAVRELEEGRQVPALFDQLKKWLNVYVQWIVNPIAFLSYIAIAFASLRVGVLPSWAAWGVVVWCALWFFIPLPLALFPVPVFLGVVLLIYG